SFVRSKAESRSSDLNMGSHTMYKWRFSALVLAKTSCMSENPRRHAGHVGESRATTRTWLMFALKSPARSENLEMFCSEDAVSLKIIPGRKVITKAQNTI